MKRKIICIVLAVAIILSFGVVAYASASGFSMTYLPGTDDTVTGMPADDSGTDDQAYTVSAQVPQREGYEFIDWTLDYGLANTYDLNYQVKGDPTYGKPGDATEPSSVTGIREGSNVTLANELTSSWTTPDGSDPSTLTERYYVNYLDIDTNEPVAEQKVVTNVEVGSIQPENAVDIDGYTLCGDETQSIEIKQTKTGKWTFTGWCSDEACAKPVTEISGISADTTVYGMWQYEEIELCRNEFVFYYEPTPHVNYTVYYIDNDTGDLIHSPATRFDVEVGTTVTEYPIEIHGYDPLEDCIMVEITEDGLCILYPYKKHIDPIF